MCVRARMCSCGCVRVCVSSLFKSPSPLEAAICVDSTVYPVTTKVNPVCNFQTINLKPKTVTELFQWGLGAQQPFSCVEPVRAPLLIWTNIVPTLEVAEEQYDYTCSIAETISILRVEPGTFGWTTRLPRQHNEQNQS